VLMNSLETMPIQYGCTRMKCGNIFKQKKMKIFLEFKTVSVTICGDYYQIVFDDGLDTDDEPYFMIQRQFEFPDGGVCHFESHHENLIDQCRVKSASLSTSTLSLAYGEQQRRDIEIRFDIQGTDFQELLSTLKEMIPETRIEMSSKC
jgi:hypothetical protein